MDLNKRDRRIIARWSSVFPGIVHAYDFVCVINVCSRALWRQQMLKAQKRLSGLYKGKQEIKVQ